MQNLIKVSSLASLVKEAKLQKAQPSVKEALCLLLDGSASMDYGSPDHKWTTAKEAATELCRLSVNSQVAIAIFSDSCKLVCNFSPHNVAGEMLTTANPPYQMTDMACGLELCIALAERATAAVKRIIVLSDGATIRMERCLEQAIICKSKGIIIDTIGFVVDQETEGFLRLLSANSGGVYKEARNALELAKQFKLLEARQRGLLKA